MVTQLQGKDVPGIIQELSQTLQRDRRIPELLPFYHAALNREFLVSTDMEAGMAFPHARLPGLEQVSFALGRAGEPINWRARSTRPVRLVFLIAIPATDSTQYLPMLSGIARLAKDAALLQKLLEAADAAECIETLRSVELRIKSNTNIVPGIRANPFSKLA